MTARFLRSVPSAFAAAALAAFVAFAPSAAAQQAFPVAPAPAYAPGAALTPPPGGRALADDEVDRTIDHIFGQARNITRLQAELSSVVYDTDTRDGEPRGRKTSFGFLRLAVPNLMWMQDYGEEDNGQPRRKAPRREEECSYMIVDGEWFYDIQASAARNQRPRGRRERVSANIAGGNAANVTAILGLFLGLERPVVSAAELRREFRVDGVEGVYDGTAQRHFRLVPLGGDSGIEIELWTKAGDSLPTRAKIVERKIAFNPAAVVQDKFKYTHTERRLSGLRTNLDGLPEFKRGAFAPPNMRIDWEDAR